MFQYHIENSSFSSADLSHSYKHMMVDQWIADGKNVFHTKVKSKYKKIEQLQDEVSKFLKCNKYEAVVTQFDEYNSLVIPHQDDKFCFHLTQDDNEFSFDLHTINPSIIEKVKAWPALQDDSRQFLHWNYLGKSGGIEEIRIPIESTDVIHDCHYPFLWVREQKVGIDEYCQNYLDGNAPILLLMGPPGTGKTTFLRYFIKKFGMETIVTYEEKVFFDDRFFIKYLTNDERNLVVVEDADALLGPRKDDNKVMSKLLNVSDGLVKLPNKKMIFTTNLVDINKIDEALLRRGRCHDIVHFRSLDVNEMKDVAKANNLPEMLGISGAKYSLAEIFAQATDSNRKAKRMGF